MTPKVDLKAEIVLAGVGANQRELTSTTGNATTRPIIAPAVVGAANNTLSASKASSSSTTPTTTMPGTASAVRLSFGLGLSSFMLMLLL